MASIVKRKKKYSVVYTYTDENGNKRQKWETFETNAEAKKRKLQVEYEQESGTFIVAIHFVQIGEIVQLKGIKQRKHGSTDLEMMPIALSVRKGQPVAAVLSRADGIGIIFVLSSFRMVSIHDIFLRFDLNF